MEFGQSRTKAIAVKKREKNQELLRGEAIVMCGKRDDFTFGTETIKDTYN